MWLCRILDSDWSDVRSVKCVSGPWSYFPVSGPVSCMSIWQATSFPGYLLLGRRWSRDLLKSSRFLISVVLSIWEGLECSSWHSPVALMLYTSLYMFNKHDLYCYKFVLIMTRFPAILNVINNKCCGTFQARSWIIFHLQGKHSTRAWLAKLSTHQIALETYISDIFYTDWSIKRYL
jgi:hypothetical protein